MRSSRENGVQNGRSKVRINGKMFPYGKELGRAISKEGESGKRRAHCIASGKTVFKRCTLKCGLDKRQTGRTRQAGRNTERQKDRTAGSQYLLCAPFPTEARRHTERAPRNRGGGMDGREPSECGSDFRKRPLVSEFVGFARRIFWGRKNGA